MKPLSREEILAHNRLRGEEVQCPEWGGVVQVRELSALERDQLENTVTNKKTDLSNLRARVAAMAIIDADGKAMFSQADVAELGKLSAAALDRVFWVVLRLSGMRPGDVEQMTENFT